MLFKSKFTLQITNSITLKFQGIRGLVCFLNGTAYGIDIDFSIFFSKQVALTMMAYQRYRQGDGMAQYEQPSGGNYNANNAGGYNKSPYASFPHPGEDENMAAQQQQQQQQQGYNSQPFGVPEQPFGVSPSQPIKTEYSVPEY